MNKGILTLIISLFSVLLLVLTNPKDEEHKAAVKAKANAFMQKTLKEKAGSEGGQLAEGLGALFGGFVIDKMIDLGVSRSNYLLFSTTKFTYEGESKTIGFGILGNVFVSSKLDEAIERDKAGSLRQ